MSDVCGTGGWSGPLPGDPDNNVSLMATPAFGGIDVSWTYPENNPEAVAYVELYRGLNSEWDNAIFHRRVNGDFYYDKSTSATAIEYFYWIIIVSVHGTRGERIGPTSATARPTISDVIEGLTGQIDQGSLAMGLKESIDKIDANAEEILQEKADRAAADDTLGFEYNLVRGELDDAQAAILEESETRASENSALSQQVDTVQASLDDDVTSVRITTEAFIEQVEGGIETEAKFAVNMDADGLIGGFGITNDGNIVEAGFDVDRFWVGRTKDNMRKPFIIEGGEVFMDEAVIYSLTVEKLRSASGDLAFTPAEYDSNGNVIEESKLRAKNIDADSLTLDYGNIKNVDVQSAATFSGTVSSGDFVSGSSGFRLSADGSVSSEINFPLTFGSSTGLKSLASKDVADWGTDVLGTGKPANNADVTGSNTAADTSKVDGRAARTVRDEARSGSNAKSTTDNWTRPYTTEIDGNKIYTGDAYVDTLQIKGNAITIPLSTNPSNFTPPTFGTDADFDENFTAGEFASISFDTFDLSSSRSVIVNASFHRHFTFIHSFSGIAAAWRNVTKVSQDNNQGGTDYRPVRVYVRLELWRDGTRQTWRWLSFWQDHSVNVQLHWAPTVWANRNYTIKVLGSCDASNQFRGIYMDLNLGLR